MNAKNEDLKPKKLASIAATILAVALVIVNMQSIYGLLASSLGFGNTGIVKSPNINIYLENECINEVSSIDWGFLEPGASKDVTLYVNNTGNIPLRLSFVTESWNPENATTYLGLTWDYAGSQIEPNEVAPVTFTLTVSNSTSGVNGFSFSIVITGTEVT